MTSSDSDTSHSSGPPSPNGHQARAGRSLPLNSMTHEQLTQYVSTIEAENANLANKHDDLARKRRHQAAQGGRPSKQRKRRHAGNNEDSGSEASGWDGNDNDEESGKGTKEPGITIAELQKAKRDTRRVGKQYCITRALFLPSHVDDFNLLYNADRSEHTNPNKIRFTADEGTFTLKLSRDLHGTIPDGHHAAGWTNKIWYTAELLKGHRRILHDLMDRIREPQLFDVSKKELISSSVRIEHRERIGWTDGDKWSAWGVPILYDVWEGKVDMEHVFRGTAMERMFSVLFFGPSSLDLLLESGTDVWPPPQHGERAAEQYKMKGVTCGSLAAAAIFCRFALSADDRLEPTGVNSHIDYRRDYYMYLEYLENGLALGKEPVIDLINDWNNKFFRHLAAARQAGGSTSEEHDDIMSQLARSREIGEEEPEQG